MGRRRLRNLTLLGGNELAAVEPSVERRTAVAEEFAIPLFATYEEGLAWGPEALVVSTPPDAHAEYALDAARRGLPFFTEASVVSAGMDELVDAVRGSASVAAPSCTMRFHPAVQRIRELIAGGAIGRPLAVVHHVGQYLPDWHPWEDYRTFYVARRETGAAREIVPFELNWLTALFGKVESLTGLRGKASELEADIDDIYSSVLLFESGVHCTLVVEVLSRPGVRRARIVGSEGTLEWDWNEKLVRLHSTGDSAWTDYPDPPPIEGPGGEWVAENMYVEEMRAYLEAVAGGTPFPLTVEEDRYLLRLLEEIERASDDVRARPAPG